MAIIYCDVKNSITQLPLDLLADTPVTFSINNSLDYSSYFVLETTKNADGFYDSTSPQNISGSFSLGAGIIDVVSDNYKAGVVVAPGGGELTFTPANNVVSSSLLLRGTGDSTSPSNSLSLLLDLYPATAAYSLRKLHKEYSGNAVRVRRASDNEEQDIGFDGENLDISTLNSFCTGSDGFVTIWYDQSENNFNAEQTTPSEQPKIYDSSTGVYLINGNPSINFDGSTTSFIISNDITGEDFAVYSVFKTTAQDPTQDGWIFDNLTSYGRGLFHDDFLDGRVTLISDTTSTTPIRVRSDINTDLTLITGIIDNNSPLGGTVSIFRNSILEDNFEGNVPYEGNTFVQYIGAGSGTPIEVFNGKMMELIMYTANDFTTSGSPSQTSIESNINSYWNIYS